MTRDRGEMRVEVGAMAQPHLMFDDQILGEHLGLGQDRVLFAGATLAQSLRAIASFLNAYTGELSAMFGPARFAETRRALEALQRARVGRIFRTVRS